MAPRGSPEASDLDVLSPSSTVALGAVFRAFGIPDADIPDLVQDVLLIFLTKRSEVLSPRPWLYQVARYRCRQYWDTLRRAREVPLALAASVVVADERLGDAAALRIDCERSLDELPPRARSVVTLRYWQGLTAREIAARTGLAERSIDKTARRSLSYLRRRLSA